MIKNGQHTFIVLFDLISFFKIAQMQINGIFAQIQLLGGNLYGIFQVENTLLVQEADDFFVFIRTGNR